MYFSLAIVILYSIYTAQKQITTYFVLLLLFVHDMSEKDVQIDRAKALMFWELYQIASKTDFDWVELKLTWMVNDVNKFHELDEQISYGNVGFVKHGGKKTMVKVDFSTNLKDAMKSLKKKDPSIWTMGILPTISDTASEEWGVGTTNENHGLWQD